MHSGPLPRWIEDRGAGGRKQPEGSHPCRGAHLTLPTCSHIGPPPRLIEDRGAGGRKRPD
eukprot:14320395-Heterocapsa_arctica.AAC.1